ncbi:MAG: hypothetical protein CMJ83_08580 [Planctomycetes bacterium]|nr:hypothetical protein [Planctomycetota bacterium]
MSARAVPRSAEPLDSLAPQARYELRGRAAETYARSVRRLVAGGRLNRFFPDARSLVALFDLLAPSGSQGTHDEIEVGLGTGLPTERMVTRVQADASIAAEACHDAEAIDPTLRDLAAGANADDAFVRRYRYHRALLAHPPPPSFSMRRELRRADPEARAAWLTVTLDRFDLAAECFVRYTILLRHEDPRWSRSQVRLDEDDLEVSENFDNLVARATARDAELVFILLSRVPSITVENVTRCRVGPLWFAGIEAPDPIRDLLADHPGEFILSLPLDRADVSGRAHRNGDPFGLGYREALSRAARGEVDELRKELGYHVRRERKFVCTPGAAQALRDQLKRSKKPCVIYEAKSER